LCYYINYKSYNRYYSFQTIYYIIVYMSINTPILHKNQHIIASPKISFIINALDNGWSVKKRKHTKDTYIFFKKHKHNNYYNSHKYYANEYLDTFIKSNAPKNTDVTLTLYNYRENMYDN
jgi:hypothetical protein